MAILAVNIRQMVSVIQIALAMAEPDAIQVDDLPDDFLSDVHINTPQESNIRPFIAPHNESIAENELKEKEDWLEAYERMNRNISKTAKELNISRNTLYKRLRESGLK